MSELSVVVKQTLGTIDFNFEELKSNMAEMMALYDGVEFKEESLQPARDELSALRKIRKAVEDKRIEIKKECLKPYDEFEKKTKELVALIDKPISAIDIQVKNFEEAKRRRKKVEIENTYRELIRDMEEYIPLTSIYDNKWENSNVSMKIIREAIESIVSSTELSVLSIKETESEFVPDALKRFRQTLSLTDTLSYIRSAEKQKVEILLREENRKKEVEARKAREASEEEERKGRDAEIEKAQQESHLQAAFDSFPKETGFFNEKPFDTGEQPFFTEKPFAVENSRHEVTMKINVNSEELDILKGFLESMPISYAMED